MAQFEYETFSQPLFKQVKPKFDPSIF